MTSSPFGQKCQSRSGCAIESGWWTFPITFSDSARTRRPPNNEPHRPSDVTSTPEFIKRRTKEPKVRQLIQSDWERFLSAAGRLIKSTAIARRERSLSERGSAWLRINWIRGPIRPGIFCSRALLFYFPPVIYCDRCVCARGSQSRRHKSSVARGLSQYFYARRPRRVLLGKMLCCAPAGRLKRGNGDLQRMTVSMCPALTLSGNYLHAADFPLLFVFPVTNTGFVISICSPFIRQIYFREVYLLHPYSSKIY